MDEPFDSPRFMIYKYHCKSVLHLSNDNLGLLFRTICEYQIDKDSLDKIDPRIAQVFPFFKNQFDLDDKKYQKKGSWYYDIEELGYKANLDNLHSAIGLEQLKKIDKMKKEEMKLQITTIKT